MDLECKRWIEADRKMQEAEWLEVRWDRGVEEVMQDSDESMRNKGNEEQGVETIERKRSE